MNRELHHEVTVTQAPTPDDEGNGMQSIIRAFIKNPVAAVEIIGFIVTATGVYYALSRGIDEAKAVSEQHYKDLSAQQLNSNKDLTVLITNVQKDLATSLANLSASDASELVDIKALFSRGDTRYRELLDKLNGHEIQLSKMGGSLEYIAKQLDDGRVSNFGPRSRNTEAQPR